MAKDTSPKRANPRSDPKPMPCGVANSHLQLRAAGPLSPDCRDGRGGTEGSNAGHTPPAVSPGVSALPLQGGVFPSAENKHRPCLRPLLPLWWYRCRPALGAWAEPGSLADRRLLPTQAASADPDLVSGSSPTCRPTPLASAGHSHDSCLDAPLSSDAALSGHVLRASGFVPYYRTPEEELHSSPGPPASSSGGQEPTGELPRPGAATL